MIPQRTTVNRPPFPETSVTTSLRAAWALGLAMAVAAPAALAGEIQLEAVPVTLDRWMYPFNGTPGTRSAASTFGSMGDVTGVDTRHGQFLLGWDTASLVPTNAGPSRYLIRHAAITVLVKNHEKFLLDPTHDSYRSFLPQDDPRHLPDADAGVPVELFGAGFRGGFTEATFLENSAFGSSAAGGRNAFAASYDTDGVFVDVGNNVGKSAAQFTPFAAWPFAVGDVPGLDPGTPVPVDSAMRFEINLADPMVVGYLQRGLDVGRLRFVLSSLHGASFGGEQDYPDLHTRESLAGDPPALDLEVTVVSDTDTDEDGLPDDWERFYFQNLDEEADEDSDLDGLTNRQELLAGTNPNNKVSTLRLRVLHDTDGLRIQFTPVPNRDMGIGLTANLTDWLQSTNPVRFPAPGVAEWTPPAGLPAAFFQLNVTNTHH